MDNFFTFPAIDPIAFSVGPIAVRWYALAYLSGFILGWQYCLLLSKSVLTRQNLRPVHFDDLLTWIMVGVILGGRLGYVLFYKPAHYFENPLEILQIWNGGMSFHGGFLGVLVASFLFGRKHNIQFFDITDILACATPIGLFFGRIANFINAELYGRPTTQPWGMVFPGSEGVPRHPSQLYEAALEGIVLFLILAFIAFRSKLGQLTGFISGVFLIGYGSFRFLIEFVREPDEHIGLFFNLFSMGQALCLPMIAAGIAIIIYAKNHDNQQVT